MVGTAHERQTFALKGVPVRLEIGPRDVGEGLATLVRRIPGDKVPVDGVLTEGRRVGSLRRSAGAAVTVTVNLSGVNDTASLANAINAGIQSGGSKVGATTRASHPGRRAAKCL